MRRLAVKDRAQFDRVWEYLNRRRRDLKLKPIRTATGVLDALLDHFDGLIDRERVVTEMVDHYSKLSTARAADARARLVWSELQGRLKEEFQALPESEQRRRRKLVRKRQEANKQ